MSPCFMPRARRREQLANGPHPSHLTSHALLELVTPQAVVSFETVALRPSRSLTLLLKWSHAFRPPCSGTPHSNIFLGLQSCVVRTRVANVTYAIVLMAVKIKGTCDIDLRNCRRSKVAEERELFVVSSLLSSRGHWSAAVLNREVAMSPLQCRSGAVGRRSPCECSATSSGVRMENARA
ncbi:hypothetical protein ERJ75_001073500 [Trypanosoma vivax]|nr:hypothetical protein ERJ75_001073500 [Trypanosoma vivax]